MRRQIAFATLFPLILAGPAFAEGRIGGATSIEKQVASSHVAQLSVGDSVYANETISTGSAGKGGFTFDDRTTLQVGPGSKVKLDQFVYAGGSGNGVAFKAAKGVFRFVSAPGAHDAYQVKTPTASIGVRGTTFAVRVRPGATDVVIYDGAVDVCPIGGGACQVLDNPCNFITVTTSFASPQKPLGPNNWSFDGACKVIQHAQNPGAQPPAPLPPGEQPQPPSEWQVFGGNTPIYVVAGGAVIGGTVGGVVAATSGGGTPPISQGLITTLFIGKQSLQ